MKARRKPVVIDYVVWRDNDATRDELEAIGYTAECGEFLYDDRTVGRRGLRIPSENGHLLALPGDHIVRSAGGWHPVPAWAFRDLYEPLDGGSE